MSLEDQLYQGGSASISQCGGDPMARAIAVGGIIADGSFGFSQANAGESLGIVRGGTNQNRGGPGIE